MKKSKDAFPQLITQTFERINQYEGANDDFYRRYGKSRAIVSSWKSEKLVASYLDQTAFIKIASEVIQEYSSKHEALKTQNEQMIKDFQTLLA